MKLPCRPVTLALALAAATAVPASAQPTFPSDPPTSALVARGAGAGDLRPRHGVTSGAGGQQRTGGSETTIGHNPL